jgi:hypothetical protein
MSMSHRSGNEAIPRSIPRLSESPHPVVRKLEIVVAHYEEDLKWMIEIDQKYVEHIYIYHKGDSRKVANDYHLPISIRAYTWIPLQNVGRESHTIIHHCLRLKQSEVKESKVNNFTLFVQGAIDVGKLQQRRLYPVKEWAKYLPDATTDTRLYICSDVGEVWNQSGLIQHHGKWLVEKQSGVMRPTAVTLGEFYQFVFRRKYPSETGLVFSFDNNFSVSNARIIQHHTEMYRRILTVLETHINPEEGHYFERLARSLFAGIEVSKMGINNLVSGSGRIEVFVPILE